MNCKRNFSKTHSNLVWLASFPRSGNTFLRILLKNNFGLSSFSIYNDPSDIGKFPEVSEIVGHKNININLLEVRNNHWPKHEASFDFLRYGSEINLVKTHAPYHADFLKDRVIYIYRDGRAALRSLVAYMQEFSKSSPYSQDFLKQLILKGSPLAGYWGSHLQSWKKYPSEKSLFLKFEDVITSPTKTINEISDFLNVQIESERVVTFDKLHSICPNFFRKGKKNSWEEVFDQNTLMLFWILNYQSMKEFGYQHSHFQMQILHEDKKVENKFFKILSIKALKEIQNVFNVIPRKSQCDIIESLTYILKVRNMINEDEAFSSVCLSLLDNFKSNLGNSFCSSF
jgi:hypothetical protein